jgi:hypothetical protein
MAMTLRNTDILWNDGSTQNKAAYFYRARLINSTRTYTTPSDVSSLYVLVWGATGGITTASGGVSAQSLQSVMAHAVQNTDGVLSVAYGNAALASCVALAREVVALKARLAKMEA